ncbi:D-isomer specific 2-hydroxyacid dehydrogenase NAD-binding protein [Ancylobacter novellus DSM 506]|uniref:D-isomer specific 2-hydroxyacid dehydrogenase NAD-binding protein n=1 Tax=Ancylobacter novellus (strain ATCC 8093 / DSM 506 / JCM 20403 / CCM 1077 / IAM 12100 / NBRC 12443 / NCIMB 10456) TaxID=639283 RepID=D7A618_ANCN5|nr:2-hydroxyacid dehydrogenase [Ancylobacter novellus]ADH90133.1 D-isomer specific 2-hydroxyacid dehydrogenase NAD-binding protein [Ancylobacter novellus DSM 506]
MSAPDRPELLQTGPMMAMVEAQLKQHFTVHRLDAPDAEQVLAEAGPRIRAVATGVGSTGGGVRRVTAALMDKLPALEIVSNFGVGYDAVDAEEAGRRGVVVTNTPGVLDDEVADLTIALLLATIRRLPQADRHLRAGKWPSGGFPLSPTLRDRTVGIVGMGRIGKAIGRRLAGFGRPIAYHSRRPAEGVPYAHYPDLIALARDVDALIVIVPGGPETNNMINAEVLEALGPKGVLINVARGSVVDEPALIKALQDGTIASAGLDVFADEPNVPEALIGLDNVVLLPHVASATQVTRDAMGQLVVDNLLAWFAGEPPLTPVPETPVRATV